MTGKYDDLNKTQLIELLEKHDRTKKLGLVWERDEIDADKALDHDFIVAQIDGDLSDKPAPWDNLVIEGDNYDALRWLRMTHRGRVKCIYIDPPYNTGNKDWVYNDRYMSADDRFRQSTWLEFLYRRLMLARDLLAEDGVILISINDDQRALLELMADEALPGMRVGSFVWRNRTGGNDAKGAFYNDNHEHVLAYCKSDFRFVGNLRNEAAYSNPDDDPRGPWTKDNLTKAHDRFQRPNTYYPVLDPETGVWYPCNPDQVWRYPSRLNKEERSFAELLDQDNSGAVKWWLRNPENETWATRLMLPSGKRFFPDFVVGIAGRTSTDGIALVEIKDDGSTGRLQSDNNIEKIRVQHREYKNVFWTYRSDGVWVRAAYEGSLHRIVDQKRFEIAEIVFLD
ncbi:site-specific DNA-methyltransferase [Halovulum sp. GXIMD14793]